MYVCVSVCARVCVWVADVCVVWVGCVWVGRAVGGCGYGRLCVNETF